MTGDTASQLVTASQGATAAEPAPAQEPVAAAESAATATPALDAATLNTNSLKEKLLAKKAAKKNLAKVELPTPAPAAEKPALTISPKSILAAASPAPVETTLPEPVTTPLQSLAATTPVAADPAPAAENPMTKLIAAAVSHAK